jgi:hypothetical protein
MDPNSGGGSVSDNATYQELSGNVPRYLWLAMAARRELTGRSIRLCRLTIRFG